MMPYEKPPRVQAASASMSAYEFRHLAVGEHRLPCPECSKRERPNDKTLGVTIDQGGGVWHCFRCGAAGGWSDKRSYAHAGNPVARTKPDERPLTLGADYRALYRSLAPIGSVAKDYLKARECELPPSDGDLRYAEALRHRSGYVGPALVALITDVDTRAALTLHRTWIRADGSKADIDPPRMLLGGHTKKNGIIRLWPDDGVTTGLAIAEGVETALTLALAFTPVWAMIDASNLAKFPVLDGIRSLLIAADHDDAGLRAADACATRWYRAGREVKIVKSPIPGQDLNDYQRQMVAA